MDPRVLVWAHTSDSRVRLRIRAPKVSGSRILQPSQFHFGMPPINHPETCVPEAVEAIRSAAKQRRSFRATVANNFGGPDSI